LQPLLAHAYPDFHIPLFILNTVVTVVARVGHGSLTTTQIDTAIETEKARFQQNSRVMETAFYYPSYGHLSMLASVF
jgi:hypothetical protein